MISCYWAESNCWAGTACSTVYCNSTTNHSKNLIWEDTYTPMSVAALFAIAKRGRQFTHPLTDECMKKTWCIHTVERYSAIKKNEILFSWNIPPSPSPPESKSLFCTSVSLFLFCIYYLGCNQPRLDAWDKCLGLMHWEDPEGSGREGGGREDRDGEHM